MDDVARDVDAIRRQVRSLRDVLRERVAAEGGAWGVDGHTFSYEMGLARPLPIGGYVLLSTRDDRRYLGQITDQRVIERSGPRVTVDLPATLGGDGPLGEASVTIDTRVANGDGRLLARMVDGSFERLDRQATFDLAQVDLATPDVIDGFVRWSLAGATGLPTGGAVFGAAEQLPLLAAKGFNRHTFLCGQSGSGKTYALGVILERLLLGTTIEMVVLDPNSDYVGLADVLPAADSGATGDAYQQIADHWAGLERRVIVMGPGDRSTPFKVMFSRLTGAQQALVLGLDPVRDADQHAALRNLRDDPAGDVTLEALLDRADAASDQHSRDLATRIRNLGVDAWNVWARADDTPLLDALPDDRRVLIADLGATETPQERSVQTAAVLAWLWRERHARVPRLVVIDEAHNVCPHTPSHPMEAMATDHVIRIAAEGRKYGLYLLLSTQQPQKIHPNVLAQCDNLIVLRMNSAIDVDHLARVFGFVPATLLRQASAFRLGEGLVAGPISSHPMLYRGARRWTREGGADVSSTWAGTGQP